MSEQRVIQTTIQRREGNTWATTLGPWPVIVSSILAMVAGWLLQNRARLRRRQPEQLTT